MIVLCIAMPRTAVHGMERPRHAHMHGRLRPFYGHVVTASRADASRAPQPQPRRPAMRDKRRRGMRRLSCIQDEVAPADLQSRPSSTPFFVAGAIESAGSRSGIIIACVAWYRSDLPGQTVSMTSFLRLS